jgi:hypothetical protein
MTTFFCKEHYMSGIAIKGPLTKETHPLKTQTTNTSQANHCLNTCKAHSLLRPNGPQGPSNKGITRPRANLRPTRGSGIPQANLRLTRGTGAPRSGFPPRSRDQRPLSKSLHRSRPTLDSRCPACSLDRGIKCLDTQRALGS